MHDAAGPGPAARAVIANPVPWGRTLAEYRAMFALRDGDEGGTVLDVAAGPASFAAERAAAGAGRTVACDPLYAAGETEIRERLAGARDAVRGLMRAEPERFVWRTFANVEELVAARAAAAEGFLADLPRGRERGRYVAGALPRLPFADGSFDLALCSHFLFLYSDAFDAGFHAAALAELARVAAEVRVFPLLAMGGRPSPHLAAATEALRAAGHRVARERVAYEVQRGGDEMLVVAGPAAGGSRIASTAGPAPPSLPDGSDGRQ